MVPTLKHQAHIYGIRFASVQPRSRCNAHSRTEDPSNIGIQILADRLHSLSAMYDRDGYYNQYWC